MPLISKYYKDHNASNLSIDKFVQDLIHDLNVNHFPNILIGDVLGNIFKYIQNLLLNYFNYYLPNLFP